MYDIHELNEQQMFAQKTNNKWLCCCRIQDGTERWYESTLAEAKKSLIKGARVLNGSYITASEITVHEMQPPKPLEVSQAEYDLLQDIKRKAKVVLEHSDPRIKCRITSDECEMILKIREGDLIVG